MTSGPTLGGGAQALLEVEDLVVEYAIGRLTVHAVSGVSFEIARGETLGLVGESGCGKSSLARAVLLLTEPRSGRVRFDGQDLTALRGEDLRRMRRHMQMVFQDPIASLNPRRRIADIIAEPLVIAGVSDRAERERRVGVVMHAVGLDPDSVSARRPHEFSGGQCQRVCIARALVLEPKLLVCDEPISSLDVSIRAQILNLLEQMKARYGLTMLFVAHDLAVVKAVSDRIAVMYLGKLCEMASAAELFRAPMHPYTATLLAAIPLPDPDAPRARSIPIGEPPSPVSPPSGCRFHTRCPRADARCEREVPLMRTARPSHQVACHHPLEGPLEGPRQARSGSAASSRSFQ
jgi:peptide/nickel transport system ATP-binding protein